MTFYVRTKGWPEIAGVHPATPEDIDDEMVERGARELYDQVAESVGYVPAFRGAFAEQCRSDARAVLMAALQGTSS